MSFKCGVPFRESSFGFLIFIFNFQEAKFAEKVVDKIELCINVVSDAIQNFKVLGENATVANTASFDMSLQRLTANKIGNSTQDVPPRPGQEGTTVGSFRLPSSEVLFANISEGVKQTPIDLQVRIVHSKSVNFISFVIKIM